MIRGRQNMKVRIERGTNIIEVEGAFDEVERILSLVWLPGLSGAIETEASDTPADDRPRKLPKKSPKRATKASAPSSDGFDATTILNDMKSDPRYEIFRTKVILSPKMLKEKVKLASWFTHELPLTSGNIHKILAGLGIKVDPSAVSRTLTGHAKHEYLKVSTSPQPTYRLSAPGHAAFESWLLNDGPAS
jgi:hypothetical protein